MVISTKHLSFCLSWVSKTQPNHRTKLMMQIAVQSHLLPLSFWPTTFTSGMEKMREEGGGQEGAVDARK